MVLYYNILSVTEHLIVGKTYLMFPRDEKTLRKSTLRIDTTEGQLTQKVWK